MGSLSTPALAAAVSNAGGLGGLGMWGFSAEDAERRIAGFWQQSSGSLNVNLWRNCRGLFTLLKNNPPHLGPSLANSLDG